MIAKVSRKGQITLPKGVRQKLRLHAGAYVRFVDEPDGVKIIAYEGITALKGRFKMQAQNLGQDVDQAIAKAREAALRERAERSGC